MYTEMHTQVSYEVSIIKVAKCFFIHLDKILFPFF